MHSIDVLYTSTDGLQLYAREYPGPGDDAPCVLCLPGLTRNSKDFMPLAEALSKTYRVICPDQRGRARSARDPRPEQYRPERYVQDMWRLLEGLHIPRVHIIGTSLGGLMAIMMAAQHADRVASVVLNDVGPEIDPRGVARIAAYVGKQVPLNSWRDAVRRTADINGLAFPDFTPSDWASMTANTYVLQDGIPIADYDPAIAQGLAGGSATPDLWPLFELLKATPALAIRGEHSDILSAQTLSAMQERLPQLRIVQIDGVGHAPTLDEPESRAAIFAFLERQQ